MTSDPKLRGALAGFLGAASALVIIEVVSLVDAHGVSVTEAVGNRFIDSFAASLKEIAVQLFGFSDKAALQIGTALVALAIGAFLGTYASRKPNVVLGGFGAFGVLGIWASAVDPLASVPVAVLACVLAAAVGIGVTIGLDRRWAAMAAEAEADPVEGEVIARRAMLVNAGVMGAALLFGAAVARSVRQSVRTAATSAQRVLTKPSSVVPIPDGVLDGETPGVSTYITPNDDFYRIDTALRVPVVDADSWKLKITGMVDRELTFTFDDLLARDLVELPITMLCVSNEVGGSLVGTANWRGVPLVELLEEAGVQDGAEQVMGRSVDGFTAGFPLEAALDGRDGLLAIGMNGESLPAEHGFPARLVIPGIYGYVSATKWISEIRLTTWDEEGYWIPRGWSRLGPIKTSSRIDVPRSGGDLLAGAVAVAGVAWAPTRGIRKVEVQVDDGDWAEATLGPVASEDTWVQWWWEWEATSGDHEIRARATDGDGVVQTAERARPDPDGATGHHTIAVNVNG